MRKFKLSVVEERDSYDVVVTELYLHPEDILNIISKYLCEPELSIAKAKLMRDEYNDEHKQHIRDLKDIESLIKDLVNR